MKIAFAFVAFALLSACASMGGVINANAWAPTQQQMEAASALKTGVSTLAQVQALYGQPCVPGDRMTLATHCTLDTLGTSPPETMLTYIMQSDWSPSCFQDSIGCQSVDQVTTFQLVYIFNERGILKSESSHSDCTAYVNEYVFDHGCLDHD